MSFNVSVLPSGRSFSANAGEPLLAAAIRQGIGLPYGCKDGACGSCKCKKLEGTVTHGTHQLKALSAEEEANGFILTCCGVAQSDVVLESRQVTDESAFPVRKMPVRVTSLVRASPDVMIIRLQLPASDMLKYHAGQYVEFLLRDGDRRSYSMANAPHTQVEAPGVELHIRHMPGGKFTDHVFGAMKEKEIQRIEGPYGSFFLREDSDKPLVLLASGTGFAPLKALIEHMQYKGITRPAVLYWGGRRPADLYMNDWMLAKVAEMPSLRYIPVISDALPEDQWSGRTGFVHKAVLEDFADLSGHQVYACGAPIVVESARDEYSALAGLPAEEFFADSFTSEADKVKAA
ncbi:CDP-6-deoxy-delta-3,4-glucoseen reductase [Polaromonas naphthalenivorans]|uniref:Oxidoreductase FAD/NAD(P)-binding domain protein n=1 Tax=Polaromonas naphthalenivorans (strain CJ2) TaxID=365044 RepID=A1VS74_POLNA|nr:CDP-6-deoxy-delta-3,4-glucoseen reductase [Polaromonas naphthalenivorans]ABM38502.1 oxidoreductase FAD/NAD(P)-binding domain protein [Polaromonas naphthalenivorans CJ2]